jgi:microsomal dipeptidase-like Zn-dependent dipeptidase
MADGYYRVDLHSHAGRCFLAGLSAGHSLVAALGAPTVADAVRAARAAGITALVLSAVADFAVLRPDPATGLHAHRDFRAGEAYSDYQRQLAGIREAAAEAGAEVVTSAAGLDQAVADGRTAVLLGCEGGDFLEGDLRRLEEARAAGGLVGAWPCGITSGSLADFGTEIIRLAEAAGPDHVALGTDLDGNYRPVLTSYDQLDDLTALLRDRGLPPASVHQILGGNALDLLRHLL